VIGHTRGYCYGWEDDPIRQLVLYKNNFGWMNVWEFNSKGLGSLWQMAFATWRESFWLKAYMIGIGGLCPF
jgi:hypothetical protein